MRTVILFLHAQFVRRLKLFIVSYHSVGYIPDSDFWPVEIETLDEVKEFLRSEVTITTYLDIELEDSREYLDMLGEIDALTEQGGIIEEIGSSLYRYSIERTV